MSIRSFFRIGAEYYKEIMQPLPDGTKVATLVKWKKSEIIQDYGKDSLKEIKKYDGFVTEPSHNNYKRTIGQFYNSYNAINHQPNKGSINYTLQFLEHIFGEQLELGLDYLSVLWKYPKQILPILCLVSSNRNTGKTTFINWLKLIFQNNLTVNSNEEFRGRFNTDWVTKLLICIDEVYLEKKSDAERLKNLATANTFKMEAKGVDKVETAFYGKFILCSNNEDSFIKIDEEEIRYWVIKVGEIKQHNPNLPILMKEEVNAFVYFLQNRKIKNPKQSRMWFTATQIKTDALDILKYGGSSIILKELKQVLNDDFDAFGVDTLHYSAKDLVLKLNTYNVRATSNEVISVIKTFLKKSPVNSSYKKYFQTINPNTQKLFVDSEVAKGRFYTFKKTEINPEN